MEVSSDDKDAILRAALDYCEGWYEGDPVKMARALHPDLAKRRIKRDVDIGGAYLYHLTQEDMLEGSRQGAGQGLPPDKQVYHITVLDTYEDIASVRAENPKFIDYLHLAKIDAAWLIVNVLYTDNHIWLGQVV